MPENCCLEVQTMKHAISRRNALASGTVTAAGIIGAGKPTVANAYSLGKVWGEDFITPWSPPDNASFDLTPGSTPVRLSCAAHRINREEGVSIEESIKSIRAEGYTAGEGNDTWNDVTDSEIRELNDALRMHDVMFYALHLGGNNCHPERAEREKVITRVSNAVETADRLGLDFILIHYGGAADRSTHPHRDNWTKATWDRGVESLKTILRNTSGTNVALAIEALNPSIINNPFAHVRLMEDIGSERIKVALDPQNMLNTATYYRTTELVNTCFDLLGENIMYGHAKDVFWKQEMLPTFEWVVAGTGCMDFETYLVRLSRMKYPRALYLEFLPREQYPEAKQYIEQTAKKVGVTIYQ